MSKIDVSFNNGKYNQATFSVSNVPGGHVLISNHPNSDVLLSFEDAVVVAEGILAMVSQHPRNSLDEALQLVSSSVVGVSPDDWVEPEGVYVDSRGEAVSFENNDNDFTIYLHLPSKSGGEYLVEFYEPDGYYNLDAANTVLVFEAAGVPRSHWEDYVVEVQT